MEKVERIYLCRCWGQSLMENQHKQQEITPTKQQICKPGIPSERGGLHFIMPLIARFADTSSTPTLLCAP